MTAPFFSFYLIPVRIRVFFVIGLAFVIAPNLHSVIPLNHMNSTLIPVLFKEFLIGLMMGFIMLIVFQAFILVGQMISMQAGLGFAVMVDPASKMNVPLISQWYLLIVTLLFLAMDGHIRFLESLFVSFEVLPILKFVELKPMLWQLLMFSSWMFQEALLVALPAILALFLVNMSFGIMARVAPQLNIFSLGLPITLLMGFFVLLWGMAGMVTDTTQAFIEGFSVLKTMVH